ncbi:MAG: hypothetical protein HC802_17465 [Caldilineaceae bacterium]|nr:hypothetical protein [Caldilineaceae bacterium]
MGRGFLRNYSEYLGMESMEVMERRRAVADERLARTLYDTSAGSSLPPVRQVDYRPKEVNLKDESDELERREIRLGPFFAIVSGLLLVLFVIWGLNALRGPIGAMTQGVGTRVAAALESEPATATPDLSAGIVNSENVAGSSPNEGGGTTEGGATDGSTGNPQVADANSALPVLPPPTETPTIVPPTQRSHRHRPPSRRHRRRPTHRCLRQPIRRCPCRPTHRSRRKTRRCRNHHRSSQRSAPMAVRY